jgi:hypothetical protein
MKKRALRIELKHHPYNLHVMTPSMGVNYRFKTSEARTASSHSLCTQGIHTGKPYSSLYTCIISLPTAQLTPMIISFLECHTVWSVKRIWLTDTSEEEAVSIFNAEDGERFRPKRRYLSPNYTASHRTQRCTSVTAMTKLHPDLH